MPVHAPHPAAQAIRPRTAVLLVLAVLAAHIGILRSVSLNLQAPSPLSTTVLSTRSIEIKAAAKPPADLPRRPVTQTPRPAPAPAPRPPPRARSDAAMTATARPSVPQVVAQAPTPSDPVPARSQTEPPPPPAPPVAVEPVVTAPVPDAAPVPNAAASQAVAAAPAPAASTPTVPAAADSGIASRPYTIPGSIRLNFDAVGKRGRLDYKAMGSLIWLQDGAGYDMRMEMGDWIIGTRVLSSAGKLTTSGLAPTRFSDKFRSERAAHFDRLQGRITFSANTPSATLMPGAQDQLSIFAQLAALVAGDPLAFPIGTTLTIQTAGPRDAEPWVFAVEREEMLHLPGGQVPALKLVRTPNKDYDQKVELWLAPELAFLPARIRITFANGDYLDQQWKSSSPP